MNEQLKKRLVGALVLVLLAVIFIPMLLDGGEETEIPTFGSNVPTKSDEQFQTIEVPLQVPPAQSTDTRPITTEQEAAAYEAQPAPAAAPATEQAVAEPESMPEPVTLAPAAAVAPAPKPVAAKPAATKPVSGWVVQLGSFGKSANALALRDKVRKKGYAAFVEQQKAASGTVYRVRVGPEIKREEADALKVKLEKAGIKGVVMPHP